MKLKTARKLHSMGRYLNHVDLDPLKKPHRSPLSEATRERNQLRHQANVACNASKFWTHNTLAIAFLASAFIFCLTPWAAYAEPFSMWSGVMRLALGFALGIAVPYEIWLFGARLQAIFWRKNQRLVARLIPRRRYATRTQCNESRVEYHSICGSFDDEFIHTLHGGLANLKATVKTTFFCGLGVAAIGIAAVLCFAPTSESFFTGPGARIIESFILLALCCWLNLEVAMHLCEEHSHTSLVEPDIKINF